jgi:hypothetical protein
MHFFMVSVSRACTPAALDIAHAVATIQTHGSARELVARIERLEHALFAEGAHQAFWQTRNQLVSSVPGVLDS